VPKPRFLLALSLPVFSLLGCTGPTSSYPLVPRPSDETCLGPSGGASEADVAWPELVDRGLELGLQERDRRNRGAAAADFNADGYPDLWLANPHDPASLFLSDGDGGFVRQEPAPTSGVDAGASIADFDGDGDPDLLVGCGGFTVQCANLLFRNDGVELGTGEVLFTELSDSALSDHERHSFGPSWADYDNDGDLDVFMPSKSRLLDEEGTPILAEDSEDLLYRNDGGGLFVDVSHEAGVGDRGHNHQSAWVDYDLDGDPDLVVPTKMGPNHLYANRGDGTFEDMGAANVEEPMRAFGVISEDFDGDGDTDLLFSAWRASGESPPRLLLSDGAGGFEDHSEILELNGPGVPLSTPTMGFQVGDLDLDGWFEILLGNGQPATGNVNQLFTLMPGDDGRLVAIDRSASIDLPAPSDPTWSQPQSYPYRTHGAVFADFDLDGRVELFMGNGGVHERPGQDEPNRFFATVGGQDNHSLRIELVGADANLFAIGARVVIRGREVDDRPWQLVRTVHRASGFNSSQLPQLLVGLGQCDGPVDIEVQWPDGATDLADSVEVDDTIIIAR